MAGPSGPRSGSLDLLQRFLGRDGSRPLRAARGPGRSSAKGETSQLQHERAAELLFYPQMLSQKLHDPTRVSTSVPQRGGGGHPQSHSSGHCAPAAGPSPGTDSLHQHHPQGWDLGFFFFFFYCSFFPSSLSLSLLLAYFCLLQGLRSFPETAFPKEATLRWTVGGKVFASPPPSLLLHAPHCCCCSELQPLFGACRGIQYPRGDRGLKIAPCSLLGPCFSLRELWPNGLGRTYFDPPALSGDLFPMTLFEDAASP